MSFKGVAVIGDVMLDRYLFGEVSRISPEAPVPLALINRQSQCPGGAAHVAACLKELGENVTLFSAVGKDQEGSYLEDHLSSVGVKSDLVKLSDWNTPVKTRIVSWQHHLFRFDLEKDISTSSDYKNLTETLFNRFKSQAANFDCLVVSDYNKKTISSALAEGLQRVCALKGIKVFVDAKPNTARLWSECFCITPNFKEACQILKINYSPDLLGDDAYCESLTLALSRLMPSLPLIVITRSQHGCSYYDRFSGECSSIKALTKRPANVTGAGDVFVSALASALKCNYPIKTSVAYANAASSVAVTKENTSVVSVDEIAAICAETHDCVPKKSESKILTVQQAVSWARANKTVQNPIVFTNGCFDILHDGHISLLEEAKSLGGSLIVAVNTDESIKQLKGDGRPFNPLSLRLRLLASLSVVDAVVPFEQDQLVPLISGIKPSYLVKGSEYAGCDIPGAAETKKNGGDVKLVPMTEGKSTTSTILKILSSSSQTL
jgi:D-beta-D-heptose 7-phosphate kinase/D-beta-D-heptose 1-phosphate adenosyltransferase